MDQWFYDPAVLAYFMRALKPGIESSVKRAVADLLAAQQDKIEYMGIKEAAKYIGFTPGSLYVLVSKRQIPHYKRSKRIYFLKSDLDEWIKNGRRKTEKEIAAEARNH